MKSYQRTLSFTIPLILRKASAKVYSFLITSKYFSDNFVPFFIFFLFCDKKRHIDVTYRITEQFLSLL
jgi:hypothetical protein